jgi:AcrR family transcriptional regulator
MSEKTQDTRRRILEATRDALLSGEGAGVRMADIARRAGVSRQALYLHFANRAELLVATTRFVDEEQDVDARLAASRSATSGRERLAHFIEAWGGYIPEIHPMARPLLAVYETDDAAREAWDDRMRAVREGCAAAVAALETDGDLAPELSAKDATDLLWGLLSVRNWEQWRFGARWSQKKYLAMVQRLAERALIAE